MDYNRKINSETSVTVNEQTITNATFIESSLVTATISGELETIEFDISVDYLGTEVSDVFTISGRVVMLLIQI